MIVYTDDGFATTALTRALKTLKSLVKATKSLEFCLLGIRAGFSLVSRQGLREINVMTFKHSAFILSQRNGDEHLLVKDFGIGIYMESYKLL